MSFSDDLKPLLNSVRSIPGSLGIRPHSVAIVVGVWSGSHTGEGSEDQTTTPITEADGQPPKVRWLKQDERALADLPEGTCEIGPITPSFGGGGLDISQFNSAASLSRGDTLHIVITGPQHPSGAVYRVIQVNADKALHYSIRAVPVSAA